MTPPRIKGLGGNARFRHLNQDLKLSENYTALLGLKSLLSTKLHVSVWLTHFDFSLTSFDFTNTKTNPNTPCVLLLFKDKQLFLDVCGKSL